MRDKKFYQALEGIVNALYPVVKITAAQSRTSSMEEWFQEKENVLDVMETMNSNLYQATQEVLSLAKEVEELRGGKTPEQKGGIQFRGH